MKERPILFSGPMVRALLAERKTQTRRIVKGVDECPHGYDVVKHADGAKLTLAGGAVATCPYGVPGDRLWVRETWAIKECGSRVSLKPEAWPDGWPTKRLQYVADLGGQHVWNKRVSIHMPRWACRMVLEVTAVRAERLFTLTEKDARAEGMLRVRDRWASDEGQPTSDTARRAFEDLWYSINGAWLDCWVWVVSFRRVA